MYNKMSILKKISNIKIFAKHISNPQTLRSMHIKKGNNFEVFGGKAKCPFSDNVQLMQDDTLSKVDYFAAPMENIEDYYSKNFTLFLQNGPNHTLRREYLGKLIEKSHNNLDQLKTYLKDNEKDLELSLVKFLMKSMLNIDIDDNSANELINYRTNAGLLSQLPKLLRNTIFKRKHDLAIKTKNKFYKLISDNGFDLYENIFDMLWFNAASLGFYSLKTIEEINKNNALKQKLMFEIEKPMSDRLLIRGVCMEILRLYPRIASINYSKNNEVKVACIPAANVDSSRFKDPYTIDPLRNNDICLTLATPSKRSCLAKNFVPDIMVTIVSQSLINSRG